MASKLVVVCDSGPIIHLAEVNSLKALKICKRVFIPQAVKDELEKNKVVKKVSGSKVLKLDKREKDLSALISLKFGLGLGESEAIALCKSQKVKMFFTDDLDARIVAEREGIEVHGSIGILLRAFREKILTEKQVIEALDSLATKSTLFVTYSLIEEAIRAVRKYSKTH